MPLIFFLSLQDALQFNPRERQLQTAPPCLPILLTEHLKGGDGRGACCCLFFSFLLLSSMLSLALLIFINFNFPVSSIYLSIHPSILLHYDLWSFKPVCKLLEWVGGSGAMVPSHTTKDRITSPRPIWWSQVRVWAVGEACGCFVWPQSGHEAVTQVSLWPRPFLLLRAGWLSRSGKLLSGPMRALGRKCVGDTRSWVHTWLRSVDIHSGLCQEDRLECVNIPPKGALRDKERKTWDVCLNVVR
jgi:hypothetical protein